MVDVQVVVQLEANGNVCHILVISTVHLVQIYIGILGIMAGHITRNPKTEPEKPEPEPEKPEPEKPEHNFG